MALDAIVNIYGENRVCLGSDYPFPLGEFTAESKGTEYCAGSLIDSMSGEETGVWTDERKRKVLGGNACEWLSLNEQVFASYKRR
jgi:aminocarboxymuconate-semialdehyde decarboxylase